MPEAHLTQTDPFNLARFIDAQAPLIGQIEAELCAGAKRSHWMWFVFPQLAGLGHSPTARFYAIASAAEAHAYLAHTLLGPRLQACTSHVLGVSGRTAYQIFGSPDDLKFRSSMTLFARIAPGSGLFGEAIRRFFNGEPDARTLDLLGE